MDRPFTIRRARPEDVFDVHRVHSTSIREGAGDSYCLAKREPCSSASTVVFINRRGYDNVG